MNDIKKLHGPKKTRTLQPQGRRELRRVVLISLFVLVASGAALVFAVTTDISKAFRSRAASQEQATASDATARLGNIIIQHGAGRCGQMIFDNKSGRIVDASGPCKKETILDERGMPRPEGTIRRLDAISKSFQRSGN
jgi:hypothetical protein